MEEKFTIRGFERFLFWADSAEDDWSPQRSYEEIDPFNEWFFYSSFNLIPRDDHRSGGIFAPEENPQAKDFEGNTPLHISIEHNAILDSFALLDRGADPNSLNYALRSPLHLAILAPKKNLTLIRKMLTNKNNPANPNLQDNNGRTPLWYAVANKHITSIRLLLDHGANPNIRDRFGMSPIDFVDSKSAKKRKITEMLQNPSEKKRKGKGQNL